MKKEMGRHCLDIGMPASEAEFQQYAIAWLQLHVGFDGVIWGNGKRLENGVIDIDHYLLQGRPQKLIEDYASIASVDPVSCRFARFPQSPQHIDVQRFYRDARCNAVHDYLEQYRIRHFFLVGIQQATPDSLDWITLYREDRKRPFASEMTTLQASAISTVLHGIQFRRAADAILRMSALAQVPGAGLPVRLTTRQQQILDCLKEGLPNKAIAKELSISENTLKTHLSALYRNLHVKSRTQAIIRARSPEVW